MSTRAKQLDLPLKGTHGGRRRGAGRPNQSGLQAHVRRPRLSRREPAHVTLKICEGLPGLRTKIAFRCLRRAVRRARAEGLRIAHFAILANHVHLIIEPQGETVGRELQSLSISFSKSLNAALDRNGRVFRERYHLHALKTPTETRRALAYVLSNEARHLARRQVRRPGKLLEIRIDPFSSARVFAGLKRLFGNGIKITQSRWGDSEIEAAIADFVGQLRSAEQSWLLREGWKRAKI